MFARSRRERANRAHVRAYPPTRGVRGGSRPVAARPICEIAAFATCPVGTHLSPLESTGHPIKSLEDIYGVRWTTPRRPQDAAKTPQEPSKSAQEATQDTKTPPDA